MWTPLTSADRVPERRRACSVGVGRAHAKAILLGEHAVVHGAPALALPVPQLVVTASIGWSSRPSDGPRGLSCTVTGSPSQASVTTSVAGLRRLATEFGAHIGAADAAHLDVLLDGAIPSARGLGSSAASARAVALALADLFGRELPESTTYDLVQTAENMTHGRASGVDAKTVGASRPLLFQEGRTEELRIGCDSLFLIADSGVPGSTKDAVELLREGFRGRSGARERFVRRASELAEAGRAALADGRSGDLGARLTDYHELLRAAGLSTDRTDALVEAALTAGSSGAKITGGGLGGCVIAQTPFGSARQVIRQLHDAGAVRTWAVPLKGGDGHAR
ncbi:mevalonate kinase [Streptomyces sp. NPDC014733]|uniref:mevalonate kinase n=1 Tax=Streptomyces sp. NPDC014733 TaxID=3364885 RepID=UPI0036FBD7B1